MKKRVIFVQIGILAFIIILANLISSNLYFRLDFTEEGRYSLSDATRDILEDLEDVVTIKAYFNKDVPVQLMQTRNALRDFLVEYEDASGGNLLYQLIDPSNSEEDKADARAAGIPEVGVNVIENDKQEQLKVYMGLVFSTGENRREILPLVQPGGSMEYDITSSIKKLTIQDKPKVGLIQGYGEPPIEQIRQLHQELSILYDVDSFEIKDETQVPPDYHALLWIDPKDTIDAGDFQKMDDYLDGGGNLLLGYSRVVGDLATSQINGADDIGVSQWISRRGISLGDQIVIDERCSTVTAQQRYGGFTINNQVRFPYFPLINKFDDHPITKGIETLMLPFASPINITNQDTTRVVTAFLTSSPRSGLIATPTFMDVNRRWGAGDYTSPNQVLGVAIEEPVSGEQLQQDEGETTPGGRIVILTNGSFMVNGEGQQARSINKDNISLVANAIDWLSDDSGLILLRTKGITSRPLRDVEDGIKELYKYGNVFVPILLILLYGVVRRYRKQMQRMKWSQGSYR